MSEAKTSSGCTSFTLACSAGVIPASTSLILSTMPSACADRLRPVEATLRRRISAAVAPWSASRLGGVKTQQARLPPRRALASPSHFRREFERPIGTSMQTSASLASTASTTSPNVRNRRKIGVAPSSDSAAIQPAGQPSMPRSTMPFTPRRAARSHLP